jgi:hypothetical protein
VEFYDLGERWNDREYPVIPSEMDNSTLGFQANTNDSFAAFLVLIEDRLFPWVIWHKSSCFVAFQEASIDVMDSSKGGFGNDKTMDLLQPRPPLSERGAFQAA